MMLLLCVCPFHQHCMKLLFTNPNDLELLDMFSGEFRYRLRIGDEVAVDYAARFPARLTAGLAGLDWTGTVNCLGIWSCLQMSRLRYDTTHEPVPWAAFAHTTSSGSSSPFCDCELQSEEMGTDPYGLQPTDLGCYMVHSLVPSTLVSNVQELRSRG